MLLGLVGATVLDVYSSGLNLQTAGLRLPRYQAALIDGTLMTLGAIYVVFFALFRADPNNRWVAAGLPYYPPMKPVG